MRALILVAGAALALSACDDGDTITRPDQGERPEVNAENENTIRDHDRQPTDGTQIP
jgi:hypothetical protein